MTSMQAVKLFAVSTFILNPFFLVSQTSTAKTISQSQIGEYLDQLGGLPAEYKADLGFDVLENNWKTIPIKTKVGALTNIFETAPTARHSSPARYASKHASSYARQDAQFVTATGLDALDIQTRSVRLALRDMPTLAVDLFSRISVSTKRATCADPLVENLSSYYDTAAVLMGDDRVRIIEGQKKANSFLDLVMAAKTPETMTPLISILSQVQIDINDLHLVVSYIAQNLEHADASDREMNALYEPLASGMSKLVAKLREKGVPESKLLVAYRNFLTSNLSRQYCTDTTSDRALIASSFNDLLSPKASQPPSKIGWKELEAKSADGEAVDPKIPMDDVPKLPLKRILKASEARTLELYRDGQSSSIQPEGADVMEVLSYAASPITGQNECNPCLLEAHQEVFAMLQMSQPAGHYLEEVTTAEIDFLTYSQIEEIDPPSFLMVLKVLVNISRPVSDEARKALLNDVMKGKSRPYIPSEDREFVRTQLHNSNDRIIKAYMAYEDAFKPEYRTK